MNFEGGNIGTWIWIADPIYRPRRHAVLRAGDQRSDGERDDVRRHRPHGLPDEDPRARDADDRGGERASATRGRATFAETCGDWAELGPSRLTAAFWGDRAGGAVSAVERTVDDTSTAWSATTTGRLFISKNVDAEPASAVSWTRLDDDAANDPSRFVSSIHVDPDGREPRVDLVQRLRREHAGHAGSRVPGGLQPGDRHVDVDGPLVRLRRPAGQRPRAGRRDRRPLRRHRLRRAAPRGRHHDVDELRAGAAERRGDEPRDPRRSERILYAATHGLSTWRLNLD